MNASIVAWGSGQACVEAAHRVNPPNADGSRYVADKPYPDGFYAKLAAIYGGLTFKSLEVLGASNG